MRIDTEAFRCCALMGVFLGAVTACVAQGVAAPADDTPGSEVLHLAYRDLPIGNEDLPVPAEPTEPDVTDSDPDSGDWLLRDDLLPESPLWYQPTYWLDPPPWDGGIELGLNGSSGNNDTLSLRTGGYIKLESRFSKFDFSGYYNRTTSSGETTQNNADMDLRNDWLLDESTPWTLYALGTLFYDQFQVFDWQMNASSGIGYRIFNEKDVKFVVRTGGGASREFGGPDNEWVPEALFGFDFEQHLTPTQKFYGKLEYYPEFEQFGQYRLVADAGWEIELLQPSNVSLKISANDRYDSTPNGVEPHLVNYSVLLLWKL